MAHGDANIITRNLLIGAAREATVGLRAPGIGITKYMTDVGEVTCEVSFAEKQVVTKWKIDGQSATYHRVFTAIDERFSRVCKSIVYGQDK